MGGGRETGREKERGRNANGSWQSSDDETHYLETHYLIDQASNRSLSLTRKHTRTRARARLPSFLLVLILFLSLSPARSIVLSHSPFLSPPFSSSFFLSRVPFLPLSLAVALLRSHSHARPLLRVSLTLSHSISQFLTLRPPVSHARARVLSLSLCAHSIYQTNEQSLTCGEATISRLFKIIGLFCKRAL